ncbi:MAG: hypothetical protein IJV45_09495 [Prevotella sp.]|nr:hypothetical protein [Prevotella sp.]
MNNDFELENMRQQMEMLKKKLEQQEIVNDRIMRKSMKRNVSSINRRNLSVCILALFMIPYCYWAFIVLAHFSLAFWIATALFFLVCIGYTYYNTKDLIRPGLMEEDLVEVRRKVARAKKLDSQWLLIGIPLVVLWICWFAYEAYRVNGADGLMGFGFAALIGGTVGAIIGFRIHFKTQRQYQEIIDQIEDISR